jgi:hypothetical protein
MTLLTVLPRLRTNNLKGLGATLTLRAEHDEIEARAVAAIACASPRSVDAMLAYAEAEAQNLIRENLNVVLALVDALVASPKGKLTGVQVDAVIESASPSRLRTVRRDVVATGR